MYFFFLTKTDTTHHQLFAKYRESYITKDGAKKFHHRVKTHKKPYTDKDYDDFLQDIDVKTTNLKRKNLIYDKKYFDYLPAEELKDTYHIVKGGDADGDDTAIATDIANDDILIEPKEHHQTRVNSRRLKRQATHDQRTRRYSSYYLPAQTSQSIDSYYVPQSNANNPWSNKYYGENRPYLHNAYLPVPRPVMQYPIKNVYYNAPHPPVNPPPNRQIITVPGNEVDVGSRFGNDDDENQRVWGVVERFPNSNNGGNQIPSEYLSY